MKDDKMKKKETVTTYNKIKGSILRDDIYLSKHVGAQKQKRLGVEVGGSGDQMV